MNKLSHSSISKYLECPRKYRHHYIERIRPIKTKSALIFGSCLDKGLNALHEGGTIEYAKALFTLEWLKYKDDPNIVYSKSDLDKELLAYYKMTDLNDSWNSIQLKAFLMLEACVREVLPLIKKHVAVQKPVSFKNSDGDEVHGFLDIIIESQEGKIYLMDNKSSSVTYEADSPKKSQQLVIYYYIEKDQMKIDEVGFFVYNKKINLNKVKTCKKCGTINTSSHKTCNNGTPRCNGEFDITYNPRAEVDMVTNVPEESDEDRVIADIDKANQGITNQEFEPNFNSCETKFGKCEYYNLCHGASMNGLKIKNED